MVLYLSEVYPLVEVATGNVGLPRHHPGRLMSHQLDECDSQTPAMMNLHIVSPDSPHEPWAVVESDALIGLVCVTVDEDNRNGWFWYWMTDRARDRGVMSRAATTVAEWALAERGLERLELGHRVNNPASGVVARRAGFVKERTQRQKFLIDGERLDVDTYGRLKTDPHPAFDPLPMVTR